MAPLKGRIVGGEKQTTMNYFRNDNATVVFVQRGACMYAYEREGQSLDAIAKWCGLRVVHPDPKDNDGLTMVGFPKTHLQKYVDLLEENGYSIMK